MNGQKLLSIITVLRDGTHVLHQAVDPPPGHVGVRIGAHIALRQKEHGDDVATFVIVHGDVVTEHRPGEG
jgi:hypothetical protein